MEDNLSWIANEFKNSDCHDKRLNERFVKVAQSMIESPGRNIHAAMGNWSQSKGAYRLFDNNNLKREAILEQHRLNICLRVNDLPQEEIILSIQDSTTLNYTHHKSKTGLNKLLRNPGFTTDVKGFHLHNTFLMTERGLPLGILSQEVFHNNALETSCKLRPINEKKSYRWLKGMQAVNSEKFKHKVITICDRESDIFEFFLEAEKLNETFVIRSSADRILTIKGKKLRSFMQDVEGKGKIDIEIKGNSNRTTRIATVKVSYAKVILKAPQRRTQATIDFLHNIELHAVLAVETGYNGKEKPLEWLLLTNHDINNFDDAERACRWYGSRWKIEEYHKILKSGCKVEDCQLQTFERLDRFIALMSIISFRLLCMTLINRVLPNESCSCILKDHEWQVLYCSVNRTNKIPDKPPCVREAVRMIGKLGGFLGRKNDREPGITVIWRGWQKLQDLTQLWLTMQYNEVKSCG